MNHMHIPPAVYERYATTVETVAKALGLRKELVWAVIAIESNFNDKAVSSAGAIGLMQLMPNTARGLGVDPHDGHANIKGGASYLKQMLHRYRGQLSYALAAYNMGPERLGFPPREPATWPRETQTYLVRFLNAYGRLTGTLT